MSTDNKEIKPIEEGGKENVSIIVKDLISAEHYKEEGKLIPLLDGLSFEILKGQKVGISSTNKEELVALIEILGNMRSYYKGYVKLSSLGTKALKRAVVEQIYYLDSSSMLYEDMSLLKHLMLIRNIYCQSHGLEFEPGVEQKRMLDYIKEAKMASYVLTPIKKMPETIKFIVSIMVALLSDSEKIVINASQYVFSYEECSVIQALFQMFKEKTIIIGTGDNKLIGMSCDQVIYLSKGKLKTFSSVNDLYKNWDKVTCSIKTEQSQELIDIIHSLAKGKELDCLPQDGYVYVKYLEPSAFLNEEFFTLCESRGIIIGDIRINHGRVANAFEEIGE
ncbi:MAG: hypothetical protein LKJ88_00525 [Bacilli bacterium]|jgi:ABC-type multidrug transport system ATPase subunit|nr:hypothetical protein [Bacilli bacterium]